MTSQPMPSAALTAAAQLIDRIGRQGRLVSVTVDDVASAWTTLLASVVAADVTGTADVAGAAELAGALPQLPAVVRVLRHARAFELAESMADDALGLTLPDETRALLALERVTVRIAQVKGDDGLADATRAALRHADAHLRAGRADLAAQVAVLVNEAVFHRELHGETERSPLAYETETFLAPLRESLTFRALSAPAGAVADEVPDQPAAQPASPTARPAVAAARGSGGVFGRARAVVAPAGSARGRLARRLLGRSTGVKPAAGSSATAKATAAEPAATAATTSTAPTTETASVEPGRRILVVSAGNLHFTQGVLADLEAQGGVEIRVLETRTAGAAMPRRGHAEMAADRLADAAGWARPPVLPAETTALFQWADTVFVDWCDVAAQWTALHAPGDVRLIIRVHSLEAISPQPHLIDWSRVSDLIFVGGHVRDLFMRAVPAAEAVGRVHLVPNEMRLERFGRPKTDAAARTIAMIGWAQMVKDPLWALDLLARLRADDPAWRLMLIGRDFPESLIVSGYRYRDAYRERAARDDVREGIVDVGYTTDLPEVLREAGFVLSCSRREGAPVGITEGAASGAVPIVRDWPMAVPFGGARRVFPGEWIVADPAEAAERLLTMDEQERESRGKAAREHVLATFDWSVVAPCYREIFLADA